MSRQIEDRNHRRASRKKHWSERKKTSQSAWQRAWFQYREAFSIIPSPSLFTREENEGAIGLGLVRIPALVVYVPFYYTALFSLALILFPFLLLFTLFQKPTE